MCYILYITYIIILYYLHCLNIYIMIHDTIVLPTMTNPQRRGLGFSIWTPARSYSPSSFYVR